MAQGKRTVACGAKTTHHAAATLVRGVWRRQTNSFSAPISDPEPNLALKRNHTRPQYSSSRRSNSSLRCRRQGSKNGSKIEQRRCRDKLPRSAYVLPATPPAEASQTRPDHFGDSCAQMQPMPARVHRPPRIGQHVPAWACQACQGRETPYATLVDSGRFTGSPAAPLISFAPKA